MKQTHRSCSSTPTAFCFVNAWMSLGSLQEEVVRNWDKWPEGPCGNGRLPYYGGLLVWTGAPHDLWRIINFSHLDVFGTCPWWRSSLLHFWDGEHLELRRNGMGCDIKCVSMWDTRSQEVFVTSVQKNVFSPIDLNSNPSHVPLYPVSHVVMSKQSKQCHCAEQHHCMASRKTWASKRHALTTWQARGYGVLVLWSRWRTLSHRVIGMIMGHLHGSLLMCLCDDVDIAYCFVSPRNLRTVYGSKSDTNSQCVDLLFLFCFVML